MTVSAIHLLRGLPVFPVDMPHFSPEAAPSTPAELFLQWLQQAIDDGVRAPHAVNVATVDSDGCPDARVVILKDITEDYWAFASSSNSPKGKQLELTPSAALTFFWPEAGRQIRIRGKVLPGSAEENQSDFNRRHPDARALVTAGNQSSVVGSLAEVHEAVARVEAPDSDPSWTVYNVAAHSVEFWQADHQRLHTRVRYVRQAEGWTRELLWP
ncbi:pyridoxine/pyridoxamine 5'-phosphate oxidase [Arthrobacter roseus]|uniref:pyridoxine/pyridoxamine 5'-phosphate oxidase n=1 Tax=Arthrobacter roseus TaxID=136274 RepID=UPI001EF967F2|nr:pyridoxal 5'-phosphate synthase [Arthrobacter roseus]MBM7846938.1 pyridoxamine 5'-phosphate oxidase [Arthrobacter roseus]